MPPQIFTHSTLEAAVCEAKLRDTLKTRHGKSGPARQGQLGHALQASYLTHLNRTKRSTDFEAGVRMWAALKHQSTAEDEKAIEFAATSFILDGVYQWAAGATDLAAENRRYFTIPDRREVPEDRVMDLSCPVFRITPDLVWRGAGPMATERLGGTANILDWKWHRTVEHVQTPDQHRQLLRYASAMYGPEEQDVVAYLGFPRHRMYYEHAIFTPEQREIAWRDLVVAAVEDAQRLLSSHTLEPDRCVGPHCKDCDLRRGCDAALRYPLQLPMLEAATQQERVTAYMLVKRLTKDMYDELKDILSVSGEPVDDGDYEADISAAESLSFDRDTIERVLTGVLAKEDIERCFTANKTKTLKVLQSAGIKPAQRNEYIDMMRVTAERKVSTKMNVSRIKHVREKGQPGGDDEGSA